MLFESLEARRFLSVAGGVDALTDLLGQGANGYQDVFVTHLTGDEEVPSRDTRAQGQAIFRLSKDGTELQFRLIVANIENVVAAHIHLGAAGTTGPVAAFLYGPQAPGGGRIQGSIATGTITAADVVGGFTYEQLIEAIRTGNAYVNVHTNDGVGDVNTGPGDFPGGEVRGQL